MVLLGISTPSMLLGQTKLSVAPRVATQTTRSMRIPWQTIGKEAYGWTKKIAPLPIGLGTYYYLTEERYPVPKTSPTYKTGKMESLIGRGARQFGESYFGSGPESYYQAQERALPLQEQLKHNIERDMLEQELQLREERLKRQAEQDYRISQYEETLIQPTTTKTNTKMPYNVRIM